MLNFIVSDCCLSDLNEFKLTDKGVCKLNLHFSPNVFKLLDYDDGDVCNKVITKSFYY